MMRHSASGAKPMVALPVGKAAVVLGLSVDSRFRLAVESPYSGTDGDPIMGEALLAAVAVLLRPSYRLATVQMRTTPGSHPRGPSHGMPSGTAPSSTTSSWEEHAPACRTRRASCMTAIISSRTASRSGPPEIRRAPSPRNAVARCVR